jgi:hypothetical protein
VFNPVDNKISKQRAVRNKESKINVAKEPLIGLLCPKGAHGNKDKFCKSNWLFVGRTSSYFFPPWQAYEQPPHHSHEPTA